MKISSSTSSILTNRGVSSEVGVIGLFLNGADNGFVDMQRSPKMLLIQSGK